MQWKCLEEHVWLYEDKSLWDFKYCIFILVMISSIPAGYFPALNATHRAWWLWSMSEEACSQSESRHGALQPMRRRPLDQSPLYRHLYHRGWGAVGVSEAVVTPGQPSSGFPQSCIILHSSSVRIQNYTEERDKPLCRGLVWHASCVWWRCEMRGPWPDRRGAGWR